MKSKTKELLYMGLEAVQVDQKKTKELVEIARDKQQEIDLWLKAELKKIIESKDGK